MLTILLLYMISAATFTLAKAVLFYSTPIMFIGVRMCVAGLFLLIYSYFACLPIKRALMQRTGLIAIVALFSVYIAYVAEFIGLEHMTSAKACLLYAFSPFISALLSYWYFSEKFTSRKKWGLCIGLLGFLPIIAMPVAAEGVTFFSFSYPELWLMISVFAYAQGWIAVKKLITQGESPFVINGLGMMLGGILAILTALAVEERPYIFDTSAPALIKLGLYSVLLILLSNILFTVVYSFLLKQYSVTFLAFVGFTAPLWAALFGRFFLGEPVPAVFFISVFFIGMGLYLYYQEEVGTGISGEAQKRTGP